MGINFRSRLERNALEAQGRKSVQSESSTSSIDKITPPRAEGDGSNDGGIFNVALVLILLVLAYSVLASSPVLEAQSQLQADCALFISQPLDTIFNFY